MCADEDDDTYEIHGNMVTSGVSTVSFSLVLQYTILPLLTEPIGGPLLIGPTNHNLWRCL